MTARRKTAIAIVVGLCSGVLGGFLLIFPDKTGRDLLYLLVLNGSGSETLRRQGPALEHLGLIGTTVVDVEPGVRLALDPLDFVDQAILMSGAWEDDSWDAIDAYLDEGDTFIDVGAHIGYYTIKAARAVGPAGTVMAVEPNPVILERLRRNLDLNDLAARVIVQPVAAFDRRDVLTLFVSPQSNTGRTSLSETVAAQDGTPQAVEVDAVPLDALVEEAGLTRLDVVKIDIEGAELTALRGAVRTLATLRPVLVLEIIDSYLQNMGASEAELRAWLSEAGYVSVRRQDIYNEVFEPSPLPTP